MKVIKNIKKLGILVNKFINNRKAISFIPTMGALHNGHLSLIQQAKKESDIVIVSIFINPKQFNNPEDLERYPRTIDCDKELIKDLTDIVFLPEANEIYPKDFGTNVHIAPLAEIGEGTYRPGHFDGVSTVVLKLCNLIRPAKAYFGKKDYQQYLIVRQMVRDLNLSIEIVGCETVREENGLAMSSRNQRLTREDRQKAGIIYTSLCAGKECIEYGEKNAEFVIANIFHILSSESRWKTEYIEIRSVADFSEVREISSPVIILIAGYIGDVRLIDNIEVKIL